MVYLGPVSLTVCNLQRDELQFRGEELRSNEEFLAS
jgi:hypothetical protein